MLVAVAKLRPFDTVDAFRKLMDASNYMVALMPEAKFIVPEDHPNYIGTYWGPVSSPGTAEIIESAKMYLFARGAVFTDYTTCGFSALIKPEKMIHVGPDFVRLPGVTYNDIALPDFLLALAGKIKPNDASLAAYKRIRAEYAPEPELRKDAPITTRRLFSRVQRILTHQNAVIAETDDSWFNAIRLRLPEWCGFEIQMQYGSIGWSVGGTLGYTLGSADEKRVVTFVGDGSFQLTTQELSTMICNGLSPIIFLINNGGYTIEVKIHDGPYNNLKNWDYAGLVD
ncbi:MAG: thiamine pyrophosphate-dependent enzyme, partial [Thermodesulfobacteriota bacterium]